MGTADCQTSNCKTPKRPLRRNRPYFQRRPNQDLWCLKEKKIKKKIANPVITTKKSKILSPIESSRPPTIYVLKYLSERYSPTPKRVPKAKLSPNAVRRIKKLF